MKTRSAMIVSWEPLVFFFAKISSPPNEANKCQIAKLLYFSSNFNGGFFLGKMFISMVYWWAIKKFTILFRKGFKVAQITKFLMFGGYIEFTFLIQYWCRFSYELIVYREFPVVCRRISYGFVKGSRKDLNFEICIYGRYIECLFFIQFLILIIVK